MVDPKLPDFLIFPIVEITAEYVEQHLILTKINSIF